jgi:hypothetical protein
MKRLIVIISGHWTRRIASAYIFNETTNDLTCIIKDMPIFALGLYSKRTLTYRIISDGNLDMPGGIMIYGGLYRRFIVRGYG